jgi:hypothetical protein
MCPPMPPVYPPFIPNTETCMIKARSDLLATSRAPVEYQPTKLRLPGHTWKSSTWCEWLLWMGC